MVLRSGNTVKWVFFSYPAAVFGGPFSGKVILYLNKENRNPKEAMADLESFPCFSMDVRDVKPGGLVVFDDRAAFTLNCDQVVAAPPFVETKFIKELKAASALLSASQGKAMTVDAAVLLPKEYYDQPGRKFPVLFWVSGYGGDYHRYSGRDSVFSQPIDTVACITVYLDGNCAGGHSVYANSDNNGPWGDALTRELIPQLEKSYRCNGARFLRGHSSGGWTVLWLQTIGPGLSGQIFRADLITNFFSAR